MSRDTKTIREAPCRIVPAFEQDRANPETVKTCVFVVILCRETVPGNINLPDHRHNIQEIDQNI